METEALLEKIKNFWDIILEIHIPIVHFIKNSKKQFFVYQLFTKQKGLMKIRPFLVFDYQIKNFSCFPH
ncbi:hypothetical protein B0E43_12790 [Algoriphagus sp. A40]|nr:hypothetical protein B0E43_12790 [Algoriphagus sp. A40]